MRHFILLSAIPGSGKSTWAKNYKSAHPNTYVVSSDEIRKECYGSVTNFSHEEDVWIMFLNKIHEYGKMDDVTVIADATNLQNKYRKYYFEETKEFEKHTLVLFDIPYEICLIQNKMRDKSKIVPIDAMERLLAEREEPSEEIKKLYDEIIVVKEFSKKIHEEDIKK